MRCSRCGLSAPQQTPTSCLSHLFNAFCYRGCVTKTDSIVPTRKTVKVETAWDMNQTCGRNMYGTHRFVIETMHLDCSLRRWIYAHDLLANMSIVSLSSVDSDFLSDRCIRSRRISLQQRAPWGNQDILDSVGNPVPQAQLLPCLLRKPGFLSIRPESGISYQHIRISRRKPGHFPSRITHFFSRCQ